MLLRIFQIARECYNRLSYKLQLLLLETLFYIMYVPMILLYLVFRINVKYLIPIVVINIILFILYKGIWSINLIH
jgi:hypothetical protein